VNPKRFFGELKRRNVYKVAVAYAVVASLLIQIATQVFPFFEIPNWTVRLVVLVITVGFPIALIIAWAFELTPEGLKRTETADAEPELAQSRKGVWIYVVIIAGALSVGVFFLGRYTSSKQSGGAELPAKSIAVLPFENLSEDKANAYFAEGIQDEILTRLAKIAELKVISRTSTAHYASAPGDLRGIAKQLGVANILEGSVQKAGDSVRVNVQLINALTDSHLWAESFDRQLTDIFRIESEIAKTIADTLQAKLSGAERSAIAARPTENSEAHDLYLRGRYFVAKRRGGDFKRAIDYFNQAVAKDPNYAPAYAGLADSYIILPEYSGEATASTIPKAKAAAEKALALDNNLAEAHVSLALVWQGADLNLERAGRELRRAIELNPNYADAHYFLAVLVLHSLGQFDQAIAEMKRAIELDPFSPIMNTNLGYCYFLARRYPEAITQLRKALELDPNFSYTHLLLGLALEQSGDLSEAIKEYEKVHEIEKADERSGQNVGLALLAHAYALHGNRDKALQLLGQVKDLDQRRGAVYAYGYALVYLGLGDKSQAIDWLGRSYEARESGIIGNIGVESNARSTAR
jgi:TolB-like protein/Tfp pilus assembly protein PilF